MQNKTFELIDKAINGDKKALSELLVNVWDMVYNLSLRMLGIPHNAEDAMQDIPQTSAPYVNNVNIMILGSKGLRAPKILKTFKIRPNRASFCSLFSSKAPLSQ